MKESKVCEFCAALFYMITGAILIINWLSGGEYEYLMDYVYMELILGTVFLIGRMILSKVEYIYTVVWSVVVSFIFTMDDGKVDDSNEEK